MFTEAASTANVECGDSTVVGDFNGDGIADLAETGGVIAGIPDVSVVMTQLTATATATATGISPVGTGTHQVEASYPGDGTHGSSVSAATPLTAQQPAFAITGTAVSVTRGATTGNRSTISVTPAGGFTGSVGLTAAVASSPSGGTSPPTFSFGSTTPVSITGATPGTATLTITTTAGASNSCTSANRTSRGIPWLTAGSAVLACIFFFGIPTRLRRWRSIPGIVLLLVALGSVPGCSGGGHTGCTPHATPATTAGTYTITVTGTSGALKETGTVTLTVQ
jgi:hypothetical protein